MRSFRGLAGSTRGSRVSLPAQTGTWLLAILCWSCGAAEGADGELGPSGGSASTGGSVVGGSAVGGSVSGGGDSGGSSGAASGGAASGGGSSAGVLNACPGQPEQQGGPGSCRGQADCFGGAVCRYERPSGAGTCGACFQVPNPCSGDASCGSGMACVPAGDLIDCQCPGQSTCAPVCTPDSCGEGNVCRNGHCDIASCVTDGYSCPDGTICDPARPGDAHRCAFLSCESEGFQCPSERPLCDPAAMFADGHGCRAPTCAEGAQCPINTRCKEVSSAFSCVRLSCTSDAECDCGACVERQCQDRLFVCVTLPA
jgi:hypothetical protein